jgi:hypothetical protein
VEDAFRRDDDLHEDRYAGASLRFYLDGLGFTITRQWEPDGRIRWCWLELGQVAVMLQEYWKDGEGTVYSDPK